MAAPRYDDLILFINKFLDGLQTILEIVEPLSRRLPKSDIAIGVHDKREGSLHVGKGIDHLHQTAPANLSRKIARRHHEERKNNRDLVIAHREPGERALAFHDIAERFA